MDSGSGSRDEENEMTAHPDPMRTKTDRLDDGSIVVAASGEIDLSCAGGLEARLRGLLGCARRLVLDLSDVRFMDSSGVHCVLDVERASRQAGVEFAIVPGPPQVRQVFRLTEADAALRFVDDRPRRRPHDGASAEATWNAVLPETGHHPATSRPGWWLTDARQTPRPPINERHVGAQGPTEGGDPHGGQPQRD
jgi:anti-sigma B factor antagonist